MLHLRPEVRQQVDQHSRAAVPQEVARRERQTTETTATSRAEEAVATAALTPVNIGPFRDKLNFVIEVSIYSSRRLKKHVYFGPYT